LKEYNFFLKLGWETTKCGAGIIRCGGDTPIAIVHNIVSTSALYGGKSFFFDFLIFLN
jgi:hypothetical protein